jgi:hypothetical protein
MQAVAMPAVTKLPAHLGGVTTRLNQNNLQSQVKQNISRKPTDCITGSPHNVTRPKHHLATSRPDDTVPCNHKSNVSNIHANKVAGCLLLHVSLQSHVCFNHRPALQTPRRPATIGPGAWLPRTLQHSEHAPAHKVPKKDFPLRLPGCQSCLSCVSSRMVPAVDGAGCSDLPAALLDVDVSIGALLAG